MMAVGLALAILPNNGSVTAFSSGQSDTSKFFLLKLTKVCYNVLVA